MPYYRALHPRNITDVFNSPSCSLATIGKEHGKTFAKAFLVKIVADVVNFFNVGKSMGSEQIAQTVNFILEDFWYLKIDDFKLCFNRAKKGHFGKVYDRIDGQIIMEWINQYASERWLAAEECSINEANMYRMKLRNFYDFKL